MPGTLLVVRMLNGPYFRPPFCANRHHRVALVAPCHFSLGRHTFNGIWPVGGSPAKETNQTLPPRVGQWPRSDGWRRFWCAASQPLFVNLGVAKVQQRVATSSTFRLTKPIHCAIPWPMAPSSSPPSFIPLACPNVHIHLQHPLASWLLLLLSQGK